VQWENLYDDPNGTTMVSPSPLMKGLSVDRSKVELKVGRVASWSWPKVMVDSDVAMSQTTARSKNIQWSKVPTRLLVILISFFYG
jgi:hypothetical protein